METNGNDSMEGPDTVSLEWFEAVCGGLSSNPAAATAAIQMFRDSDRAIDTTLSFLQLPFGSLSHQAHFQALSILHYASLARWITLSVEHQSSLRLMLRNQLNTMSLACQQQHMQPGSVHVPSFLLNKTLQVYVSLWKRSWIDVTADEKHDFFQHIRMMLPSADVNAASVGSAFVLSCAVSRIALMLLKVVIEEFSNRSYAEMNIQVSFHLQVKQDFETGDLLSIVQMIAEQFQSLMQQHEHHMMMIATGSSTVRENYLLLVREQCLVLTELFSWDFKWDPTAQRGDQNLNREVGVSHQLVHVPVDWKDYIVKRELLRHLFNMYSSIRALCSNISTDRSPECSCLLEIKNVILCYSCLTGEVLGSPQERILFGDHMLSLSAEMVKPSICSTIDQQQLLTHLSRDYNWGGVREEDFDLFVQILLRAVGNYTITVLVGMQHFEIMMMTLGDVTRSLAADLSALAAFFTQQYDVWHSQTLLIKVQQLREPPQPWQWPELGSKGFTYTLPTDVRLWDTWRMDKLMLCLDCWGVIMEDPTVLFQLVRNNSSTTMLPTEFRSWLEGIAGELFTQLFDTTLQNYVMESVATAGEEEHEEDDIIDSRENSSVLRSLCVVGRSNLSSNLQTINAALHSALDDLHRIAQQSSVSNLPQLHALMNPHGQSVVLQVLERTRWCIEVLSYLLIDDFQEHSGATNGSTLLQLGESPTLHNSILEFIGLHGNNALSAIGSAVHNIIRLLKLQADLFSASSTSRPMFLHPLLSPLLIQTVYDFVWEFISHFLDPNSENYSAEIKERIPQLHMFYGDEFNSLIDAALECGDWVVKLLPLELGAVWSVAQCIGSLSLSVNPQRLQHSVNHPALQSITQFTFAPESKHRLNDVGLAALTESIGSLFIRAQYSQHVIQLCSAIYQYAESNGSNQTDYVQLDRCTLQHLLAALLGLAKCPRGEDTTLHGLFDACWSKYLKVNIPIFSDGSADDILMQYLELLRVYSEHQLSRLKNDSCRELYSASYQLLQLLKARFEKLLREAQQTVVASEESTIFRKNACNSVLDLLNNLTSKEFSFTEDNPEESNESFETEVAAVLMFGLQVMIPMTTEAVLEGFPTTTEKFASFCAYFASSYIVNFAQWLSTLPLEDSQDLFTALLHRLVWCAAYCVDGTAAREALQALQALAVHQWKCMHRRLPARSIIPFQRAELLQQVCDRFVGIIFKIDGSKSLLLSWDRVDAVGNTLISFIALDFAHFHSTASSCVTTQPVHLQTVQLQCLDALTTARGVDMNNLERKNRLLFVQNFREFVAQIKSLGLK